jgi:hypothetical protein
LIIKGPSGFTTRCYITSIEWMPPEDDGKAKEDGDAPEETSTE